MEIESLTIQGFRNITHMEFAPCPGTNVIYGNNAQGKTNLLEAVWLFSGAKSFRGAKDHEYIGFGSEKAELTFDFLAQNRPQKAGITYTTQGRSCHLNGVKQDRVASLSGVFYAVVFSPDHLSLVKEGPEKRRKMMDISLCQAYPKYGSVLERYEKCLRQRNRLLKDIQGHAHLLDTLEAWDLGLLEYGAYIMRMRARYIRRLAEKSREIYEGISRGGEQFSARYLPSFGGSVEGFEKQQFRDSLQQALAECRADDIRLGTTGQGPHRDDLVIDVNGVSARSFGSQGQQRSAVLALKLAECDILQQYGGEPPVVLLDDVLSELDGSRREYLLNQLTGRQVLITCCHAGAFAGLADGRVFQIQAGALVQSN